MTIRLIRLTTLCCLFATLYFVPRVQAQTLSENFETGLLTSAPASPTSVTLPSGVWIMMNAYRGGNVTYQCSDGGVSDLRVLKNGGYAITPSLSHGAGLLTFKEGRGSRTITIQKSTDDGATWTTIGTPVSVQCVQISIAVNDPLANRLKIWNNSASDEDIDNVSITAGSATNGFAAAPDTLTFGNAVINTTSSEQSYVLTAGGLTPDTGSITISLPPNFQAALTTGGPYSSSILVNYTGGSIPATTVYTVFQPSAAQSYSGFAVHTGGGAAEYDILLTGTGVISQIPGAIYVSPTGSDANPGTIGLPFATLSKALTIAGPDSLIYLRGGIYSRSSTETISKNGSAGKLLRIWAYPGETPVYDFATQTSSDGISLKANYIHLRGIEVKNAFHNGINISGSYNTVEYCRVHDNKNTGMQMGSSSSTANPGHNLIINCDAYYNYDAPIGGNADGFGVKWNIGTGNVFKYCRAYNNSDDGWDLWMADSSIEIDSCFAFRNGVNSWASGTFDGNGNGFKLGGNYIATPHTVKNCVSFDNFKFGSSGAGRGFDENNNTAGQTLYNCTSYRNAGDNYHFTNTVVSGAHVVKNCISYIGVVNITSGTQSNNSWQGFTVSAADFRSIDTSVATAPRGSDGSLPANTFFRLAAGSPLINAGVNVGLPYYGSAPDLGAFEYTGLPTYALTTIGVNGTVTRNPNQAAYDSNTTVQLTAVPAVGYEFVNWSGDLAGSTNPASILMNSGKNVTANCTIITYQITVTQGAHGTVAPGSVPVSYGGAQRFVVTPDSGYHCDSLIIDGVKSDSTAGYTFTNVTGTHTVRAVFAVTTFQINAISGPHGTVIPSGTVIVAWGASQGYTVTPDSGYHTDSIIVDGSSQTVAPSYTFSSVKANHTLRGVFASNNPAMHSLTIQSVNGSVTKNPDLAAYAEGAKVILTAVPSAGYHFTAWSDSLTGAGNPDSIVMNSDKVVTAAFVLNVYSIAASASAGGSIHPAGSITVPYGSDTVFTFTPSAGYHLDSLLVDGARVDSPASYRFHSVSASHTISAWFSINRYTLGVTSVNGSVVKSPDITVYPHGTQVILTAVPDSGYHFAGWSGDLSGTVNPDTIVMLANTGITALFEANTSVSRGVAMRQGWNLLSLPVQVPDPRTTTVFPGAISKAFSYDGAYVRSDSLLFGKGYWLKVAAAETLIVVGSPVPVDSIPVVPGWNMIGGNSFRTPVNLLTSFPPGMVSSRFFGYRDRYVAVDTLEPGSGYWVRMSGAGTLVAGSGAASSAASRIRISAGTEVPPAPPEENGRHNIQPEGFRLFGGFPNPFNASTQIRFSVEQTGPARLEVVDCLGRIVATLFDAAAQPGSLYSITFSADNLPSGVYFARLSSGGMMKSDRLLLVK